MIALPAVPAVATRSAVYAGAALDATRRPEAELPSIAPGAPIGLRTSFRGGDFALQSQHAARGFHDFEQPVVQRLDLCVVRLAIEDLAQVSGGRHDVGALPHLVIHSHVPAVGHAAPSFAWGPVDTGMIPQSSW